VNDVPASQEAHLRASTACYDESFAYYICEWCSCLTRSTPTGLHILLRGELCLLYMWMMFLPHSTPMSLCGLLRGELCLLYMWMMFVPHSTPNEPLRPVTGTTLFVYVDYILTSQETRRSAWSL
jgi:hypothetical protein